MELIDIRIHGFRRFRDRTTMNVANKLVAVVGPNEAGKSSFLKALVRLNDKEPFEQSGPTIEISRGLELNGNHYVVEAVYLLESADSLAIAHIEGFKSCKRLTVFKAKSGSRSYKIEPRPMRSLTLRKGIATKLSKFLPLVLAEVESEEIVTEIDLVKEIPSVIESLMSEEESLPKKTIDSIKTLSETFLSSGLAAKIKRLDVFAKSLNTLAEQESTTPHQEAINILAERVPLFRLFGDAERTLQSEYSLVSVKSEVPTALANLVELAGLDLAKLITSAEQNDRGEVATILRDVNRRLAKEFNEAYSQSKAAVQFDVNTDSLFVLVDENPLENNRLVQFAERSDGLRQYVALISFLRQDQDERETILLIDEAETHLHYDAQADLVQMLAKQDLVKKVIYTTHSIGCLPEDLGMGVRLIERFDESKSKITNWFWLGDGDGFSPLLFGMGAQTLAFIPVRRAVITEGVSDMILLPSMFREVAKKTSLGFQVVPGLSEADDIGLISLERASKRTLFLTDSDGGGDAIRDKLLGKGFEEKRIFQLPKVDENPTMTEDFIHPDVYVSSVNELLERFYETDERFDAVNLPDTGRPTAIENWFEEKGLAIPSKRAIAYLVVENDKSPLRVDPAKRAALLDLVKRLTKAFDAEALDE